MEARTGTAAALRFGSFELDVRSRELRSGDTCVRLQEQPFEILRFMLERPGDVVTREELRDRLWPNGTFVDFEHSLNAAVKRLRSALGDNADNPTFVETLPRRGYRFIAPLAAEERTPPPSPRLAVLPFTNLSHDAAQDYFSDGLTEELISRLGRLCRGRVSVIAHRSSMAFKGSTQRAREIAQTLNATYLLEGSVRRDGPRVRIIIRLIEGETESELWSDTHDRTVDDWLSVQSDVAAHVAHSILPELSPDRTRWTPTPEPRAHEAYLQARYLWALPGDRGLDEALRLCGDALTLAPGYAAAHALVSRLMIGAAEYYRRVPIEAFRRARESAARALELDPSNGDALVAMADLSRLVDFDWRAARTRYREVLATNPSTELAHRGYAFLLSLQGRHDDAIRAADVARELDPICRVATVTSAWTRYMAGRYDDAIDVAARTIDRQRIFVPAMRLLAFALLQAGDRSAAVAHLERAVTRVGRDPHLLCTLAHVYAADGRMDDARALVHEVSHADQARYVSGYCLALAHMSVGSIDAAIDALHRACRDRDPQLAHAAIEPRFEPMRTDARFNQLIGTLNLARPQVT
jgi:TolB-like protein/Tfp pilus assembly protein PilF